MSTHTNPFEAGSNYEQCVEILEITEDEQQAYARECQKIPKNDYGKASGKDCFTLVMSTGVDLKDLQKTWSIIDSEKEGTINECQHIVAKALILSLLKTGGYPDNLPP